ncbi:MAG TPA: hypothetical protein VLA02_00570 [Reyranella sp.]|nr:hypothetical protein [Reyranella sp.]
MIHIAKLDRELTTVVLRVPRGFVDQVLWPEFQELVLPPGVSP